MTSPTPSKETSLLVDLLPMAEQDSYYDDRAEEALLIEDLRKGRLSVCATVAAESYEGVLRACLHKSAADPLSYADWARFRYFLQLRVSDFLLSLAFDDFAPPRALLTGGVATLPIEMRELYDLALAEETADDERDLLYRAGITDSPPADGPGAAAPESEIP